LPCKRLEIRVQSRIWKDAVSTRFQRHSARQDDLIRDFPAHSPEEAGLAASTPTLLKRLQALSPERLAGMRRGIEKESLRADAEGLLVATPHPAALGSALTHPHITTDFSESQVELVTGAHKTVEACFVELGELHQLTYRAIGEERLWVASMPCRLPADGDIPIGQYGASNVGRAKSVYRMGLSHRYGRRMQTISGIHYNWSLPGLNNDDHFALIRNFRRHSFLLLWLFGASPAVNRCFVSGQPHGLQPLGEHSLHLPHATSLRMGRLGYQSDAQASLSVSYNGLEGYASSLQAALTQPYAPYEAIGIRDAAGGYKQLSTSLLQIENEFYGTIRPKRAIGTAERPLHALRQRGVEYIEVRCMDLDPYEPAGIRAETARFLDTFLLHCLLTDSPPDTPDEVAALARNQHRTAARGREPGLRLERGGAEVQLVDWAAELLEELGPIASALDAALHSSAATPEGVSDGNDAAPGQRPHESALQAARLRLLAPETTPSARVLADIAAEAYPSFAAFVQRRSDQTREHFLAQPLGQAREARWASVAAESLAEQARLEAAETRTFEEFRLDYLSPHQLG